MPLVIGYYGLNIQDDLYIKHCSPVFRCVAPVGRCKSPKEVVVGHGVIVIPHTEDVPNNPSQRTGGGKSLSYQQT